MHLNCELTFVYFPTNMKAEDFKMWFGDSNVKVKHLKSRQRAKQCLVLTSSGQMIKNTFKRTTYTSSVIYNYVN